MMESAKGRSEVEFPGRAVSPCWKKKAPDAGFLANVKDHLDQFVSTPMDQHRICLKKTIRGVGDYVKLRKQSKEARQAIASSDSASKDGDVDTSRKRVVFFCSEKKSEVDFSRAPTQ